MQVHELLLNSTAENPKAPMVSQHGNWHSYADILARVVRVAHFLAVDLALPKGSRVALYWENSADAIAASFGVWFAGCVLVSLSTDLSNDDVADQIQHSDAAALIVGQKQLRHLHTAAARLEGVMAIAVAGPLPPVGTFQRPVYSWPVIADDGPALAAPVRTIDLDLAAIVYTSGSTGAPKGVMLSHLNLVSNMQSIVAYLRLSREDRVMMILPHYYIYGLSLILTHVLVGGAIVLDNRFMYPNTVLQSMVETRVTGFAGVPSTFSILLARSTVREMEFPLLRYVTQAGGDMPPPVQKQVAEAFSPARLFIMYGTTEAAPRLSYLDPDDLPRKLGSIGKPVPNVDLFIADSQGTPLSPGVEGEIVARGANITSGYWKDPEGSAQVLRNGLYFTGDLGTMDQDGFFYVTGRAKDIIKVKGFRVSPREIEEHLLSLRAIAEAAVVGIPDDLLGEAPVAFLVPCNEVELATEAVQSFLRQRLPAYKLPVRYVILESLPKGAAGKVQKRTLRKQFGKARND